MTTLSPGSYGGDVSASVIVYGPDGKMYSNPAAAMAAGVTNYTMTPPATTGTAPVANIPTYGYELQKLMQQYGVSAPVAPRTSDQKLLDQYFSKLNTPMYEQPSGNALFNKYLDIGMGKVAAPFGPMTDFFPGQAVCPEGQRYDPVTTKCVSVTAPGGVAEAGRITTGTPNIGGNQCPPGFNFDPATRSCVPTPITNIPVDNKPISEQQPMPTCPPNTTLDPVNRICIPKGCPAGYEMDANGNCVAKSMQVPCPPGFTRDAASGACIQDEVPGPGPKPITPEPITPKPITPEPITPEPCLPGYVRNSAGACVPDPEQVALVNKYYGKGAGGYDLYSAVQKGDLDLNVARDVIGADVVDPWLSKAVDPDKTFSSWAIQNLATQRDNNQQATGGSGAEKLFDLYQQGSVGLGEIEDALGKTKVQNWMKAYRPDAYKSAYGLAEGGRVDFDSMVKKYQVGGLNRMSGFNPMVMGQQEEDPYTPPMFIEPGLRNMMDRYDMRPEQMIRSGSMAAAPAAAPSITAPQSMATPQSGMMSARERYDEAAGRLRSTIEELSQAAPSKGPSKAEMYFRLAAAFGRPTATGNFFESLGEAGQEMAAYKAEQRAAESSSAEQRRNLALELAKFDVTQAKDLMQAERELMSAQGAYGRQAADEGLVRGTPAFTARVQELANEAVERDEMRYQSGINREQRLADTAARAASRMTAGEMRLMSDAGKEITAGDIAISALNQAIDLSEDAYTASIGDQAARAWAERTDPQAPKVVATRVMEQLVKLNVLNNLKLMFGGNPTEGERAIAFATAGLEAISITERNENLKLALDMATTRMNALEEKVSAIKSGEYAEYEEEAVDGE
jgi:hypothetical protein